MRVLVFGDVHGNLIALEKMTQKVAREVDMMVSHGDVVNYGPWSNECVELLENINCICLQGNHETFFLKGIYPGENRVAKEFFNNCYPLFEKMEIIKKYGESIEIGGYQVQHTIGDTYIYPDTDINLLNIKNDYIIGHSHHQFFAETSFGIKLFNTGSVGQNREFINVINYIMLDTEKSEIRMEAMVYDVDLVINHMKSKGYPQMCLDYYLRKKRL